MIAVVFSDDMISKVISEWDAQKTMNEISRITGLSVGNVKSILMANGHPECASRSEGARRHYAGIANAMWPDIRKDLDTMELRPLCKKYGMTKQRILDLFDRQEFDYDKFLAEKNEKLKSRLERLRFEGKTVDEIANVIGCCYNTAAKYLQEFGLTEAVDRTDISDQDVLDCWNSGMTVNGIAKKFGCSHDTITKRLAKHGIHSERAAGIERHFDSVHEKDWDGIRKDLDRFVPLSEVAVRHGLRYEALYRMMERHGYEYGGIVHIDEKKLADRISGCKDRMELEYLLAIRDLNIRSVNAPVVYTLARFMNRTMDIVRRDAAKYDLFEFLGNNNTSMKVTRVLHDLDGLGIRYELNNRSILKNPDGLFMEIDIWLPDYGLGIEVNPTFTHSVDIQAFGKSDQAYHQKKSLLAIEAGIGLVHLYDSDFIDESRYQVFLRQLTCMVKAKTRIGARQCEVRPVDRVVSNGFLEKYHFQGGERSSQMGYGLFHGNDLVGVMTFGKSRYTDDRYEIIRYCIDPGYVIHGGFEKLFRAFLSTLSGPASIVSYMDLNKRLRARSVYDRVGFTFQGLTPPDYVWYNQSGTKMKSRYSTTKAILVKQGFDPAKSEIEIMRERHFVRVFGAGSKKYVYQYGG